MVMYNVILNENIYKYANMNIFRVIHLLKETMDVTN